jgi:hypothetical protein
MQVSDMQKIGRIWHYDKLCAHAAFVRAFQTNIGMPASPRELHCLQQCCKQGSASMPLHHAEWEDVNDV